MNYFTDDEKATMKQYEHLYATRQYHSLAHQFCHEGCGFDEASDVWFVCSGEAPTIEELAKLIIARVRAGHLGC